MQHSLVILIPVVRYESATLMWWLGLRIEWKNWRDDITSHATVLLVMTQRLTILPPLYFVVGVCVMHLLDTGTDIFFSKYLYQLPLLFVGTSGCDGAVYVDESLPPSEPLPPCSKCGQVSLPPDTRSTYVKAAAYCREKVEECKDQYCILSCLLTIEQKFWYLSAFEGSAKPQSLKSQRWCKVST